VSGAPPDPAHADAPAVALRGLVHRYAEDLPPALDGLDLTVARGEALGWWGRTAPARPR